MNWCYDDTEHTRKQSTVCDQSPGDGNGRQQQTAESQLQKF